MPTFNVIVPEGRLSSEQKTKVAVALGGTYKELTGVQDVEVLDRKCQRISPK